MNCKLRISYHFRYLDTFPNLLPSSLVTAFLSHTLRGTYGLNPDTLQTPRLASTDKSFVSPEHIEAGDEVLTAESQEIDKEALSPSQPKILEE